MNLTPYNNKVFLLGGYDLEMVTIKQMLEGKCECVVLDQQLKWDNACLGAYQDELPSYTDSDIYGIELQEDIPLPAHYHRIDHHNDCHAKPSALEQVAEIIGVGLNHHQQLVAANDRGYIPAMQKMGASTEEIADIRKKDRKAQGITESEEQLAEKSISDNLLRCGELIVVKSLTSRFAPICDRLFPYQRLLIYTDSEWMFYGAGKTELVNSFCSAIIQKKVFHGGGDRGYIGCVKYAFSTDDIMKFVGKMKEKYECI